MQRRSMNSAAEEPKEERRKSLLVAAGDDEDERSRLIRALDLESGGQMAPQGLNERRKGRRNSTGQGESRAGGSSSSSAPYPFSGNAQYNSLGDTDQEERMAYVNVGVEHSPDPEDGQQARLRGCNVAVVRELEQPVLDEEERKTYRNMVLHGDPDPDPENRDTFNNRTTRERGSLGGLNYGFQPTIGQLGGGGPSAESSGASDAGTSAAPDGLLRGSRANSILSQSPSAVPAGYCNPEFVEAVTHEKNLTLEWRNLTFKVGGAQKKAILKDCYGKLYPGQVCALIGPSGAGKSTLMNLLAGRQSWKGKGVEMTGEVRYGGKLVEFDDLKSSIAYVMQQDALLGTQTVYETLLFAARMKLPASTNAEALHHNVETTLKQLDLWEQRNVPIGDAFRKGISGGQKKRVSAALELLTRPSVMFLDEPTSGLDSFSSLKLIAELKNIAVAENAIICCTIHQPSSEIFDNFDRVICMREGEIMFNGYNGKAAEALVTANAQEANALTAGTVAGGNFSAAALQQQQLLNDASRIYTIMGFLELIVGRSLPTGYNTADWLLYLAQSMDEEEAREVIEQCARAYELRNHGYAATRVPLVDYRAVELRDAPPPNVMSLDKKNVYWGQDVGGGKTALDDLFTVPEHAESQSQEAVVDSSGVHAEDPDRQTMLAAAKDDDVDLEENPTLEVGKQVRRLNWSAEIIDYMDIGVGPDALKRMHVDAQWIQEHPATKELMLARQKQNGLCFQLWFLTQREWVHRLRDPWILFYRFLIPIMQVTLFAVGFTNIGRQLREGHYDREGKLIKTPGEYGEKIRELYGAANNIIWIFMFSTAGGFSLTIPQERAIFLREYHSNLYGIIPYVLAKIMIEMLIILVQAALLQVIVYFAWGMNSNFFFLWGVTFLLGMGGSAIGLFLASLNCNAPERSVMMTPIFLSSVPNVFSGAFRAVSEMPSWMNWMAYVIPSTHGLRLIGYIENKGYLENHLQIAGRKWKPPHPDGVSPPLDFHEMYVEARTKWWERHMINDTLVIAYSFALFGIIALMYVASIAFLKFGSRSLYM
ncbi:unnamed protein product [Amoebophrya sp. A25]|nr:unnamed protein product [Amoebophrya sp. A25]|eukprot:GSA25T00016617001.1